MHPASALQASVSLGFFTSYSATVGVPYARYAIPFELVPLLFCEKENSGLLAFWLLGAVAGAAAGSVFNAGMRCIQP